MLERELDSSSHLAYPYVFELTLSIEEKAALALIYSAASCGKIKHNRAPSFPSFL
jgi:hypothetical protein